VRYLNGASQAIKAGNKQLAQSYLDRALAVFDDGQRRGHYGRADAEMIKNLIRVRTEAAMKGEQVAKAAHDDERWSGYTEHKPLGLTNEVREQRVSARGHRSSSWGRPNGMKAGRPASRPVSRSVSSDMLALGPVSPIRLKVRSGSVCFLIRSQHGSFTSRTSLHKSMVIKRFNMVSTG
jgi:hypothetical protein